MDAAEIVDDCKRFTMYSWSKGEAVDPIPFVKAERVWLTDATGKRWLDWNSQAMSVNIGHSHPRVIAAMKRQLDEVVYTAPGTATAARARLGRRLAEVMPGHLNTTFFTLSGAEANENAVRAARAFTGRQKVLARYRSYHGASALAIALTGDERRLHNEPGPPGVVHVLDPRPYDFRFGDDEDAVTANHLRYLEEVVTMEGPSTIAAMIVETVTGTNGVLVPPRGWLQGLHALLQRHGILLICDEVMAGFGRTGKLFAFSHWDVVPDMVTMAKGLTSSYFPLGAFAMSDAIAAFFQKNKFWGGLTYHGHALGCATALANLDVLLDEGMIENAARLEPVMRAEMERLRTKHPCVAEGRAIGLFGMMDLRRNARGEPWAPYAGSSPTMAKLGERMKELGLYAYVRPSGFTCIPPLCITEEELRHGFSLVDQALDTVDADYEG